MAADVSALTVSVIFKSNSVEHEKKWLFFYLVDIFDTQSSWLCVFWSIATSSVNQTMWVVLLCGISFSEISFFVFLVMVCSAGGWWVFKKSKCEATGQVRVVYKAGNQKENI